MGLTLRGIAENRVHCVYGSQGDYYEGDFGQVDIASGTDEAWEAAYEEAVRNEIRWVTCSHRLRYA